jgi:hypothetical protein
MYPKNAATPPRISVGALVQISDGAVQTTGASVGVTAEGGAEGAGGGTLACLASGVWTYIPLQAETNYSAFIVTVYKTGCIPATVTVVTTLSPTAGQAIVPDTQKVDVNTLKTQTITCAAGVTILAQVGAAGAPGASGGLPTTNGTKLNQTVDLTAGQSIACSDKTGFSLAATGADLILKTSTFVQAIAAAINELATYGLTALNTLLVTTGIKAATIPNATLANGAHGGAAATITLQTPIAATVPDSQKVDVNTIKTKGVTVDAGGTTFPASVGSSTLAAGAKMDLQDAPNATALNAIADAYLDRANAIETGLTPRSAHRLEVAVAAGKISGAATTTVEIKNAVADSKTRITATVDADGNRSAVTTDVS